MCVCVFFCAHVSLIRAGAAGCTAETLRIERDGEAAGAQVCGLLLG
jgi:hypothetical protein